MTTLRNPAASRRSFGGPSADPSADRTGSRSGAGQTTAPWVLLMFFLSLPLLMSFDISSIRVTPIRAFLLISVLPTALIVLSGRAGRVLGADYAMGGFALWVVISLLVNDGLGQLANAVMTAQEAGRKYINVASNLLKKAS